MPDEIEEVEEPQPEVRLRETGNGPSISYEESLLREYFGEPDDNGVYDGAQQYCVGTAEQWANCACTEEEGGCRLER